VAKIEILADKLNRYLAAKHMEPISGTPKDLITLYEATLRSIWKKIEDSEERDNLAVEVGNFLNPFFGGRNVADALKELSAKLDDEMAEEKEQTQVQELKDRMKDPGYIPTFEELLKAQEDQK